MSDDEVLDGGDEVPDDEELGGGEPGGGPGTLGFVAGLVLGALVGAGVALLVAPDRGSVTRKRLKRFVRRVRSDTKDRLDDWRDDVKSELARRRRQIREQIER